MAGRYETVYIFDPALEEPAINEKLTALIAHTNAAALGTVGAVTLVITDITTLGTIERAFNHIWRVPRGRSYLRKFTDYLSVTFTVPVLLAVALGLSARFVKHSPVPGLSSILPFLLVWPGFLFLFVFFSYTRVRWGPALLGSLVTAVLWQAAQWGYIHFQVRAGAYQAIYGALAAIPVLLLWLYISWGIVLFGVEVTAAAQHGAALLSKDRQTLGLMRAAALLAMVRLGQRARDPGRVLTAESLAHELGLDHNALGPMLERLKHSGLVVEAQVEHLGRPGGLFLAREAATLRLDEILESVCGADDLGAAGGEPRIGEVLARLARLEGELLRSMTLSDLLGAPEVADHKHA